MPYDLCRVGQLLRETREKKGITFDEVSNVLFVKTRVIEAIEAGDLDSLPALVYVKGYVTQYAAFLNIRDLVESELAPKDDKPPLRGIEGVSKGKKGILRGWRLRKRGAIDGQQLSDGTGDLPLPIAVTLSYRPAETNSSDEGEESVVHETNARGEERTWAKSA